MTLGPVRVMGAGMVHILSAKKVLCVYAVSDCLCY